MQALLVSLVLAAAAPSTASSQLAGLRQKAAEAARKAEDARRAREAQQKAAADSARAGAAVDSAARARAADSTKPAPSSTPSAATAAAPARQDPKVWDNYDFVPGSKVLFFTDFSDDRVGNFARRLRFVGGQLEVVERDDVKVLRSTARSTFLIPVGRKLPQRFTLEIDIIAPAGTCCGYEMLAFEGGRTLDRGANSGEVIWHANGTWIIGSGQVGGNGPLPHPEAMVAGLRGQVAHVRVLMDSAYFKMYTNERRMYNIPEMHFKRDSVIRVFVNGGEGAGMAIYITSIRLAESEHDVMYDALEANGRWVTQGILFATGKADLRPESRPVLKEIAATMKEHPDLRILIEGHTDNVGAAAANLALSDARAAAVKAALVADFGVAADRMTTKGLGDTRPSVPNATPEGRAQNRRVEIVKQTS
jgi:outer membrane protein OmpA-like peptidoglycan-associated protein